MYKYNKEGNVGIPSQKIFGIHPGNWRYQEYQDWLDEGNTTEPYQTEEELQAEAEQNALLAELEARVAELEEAQEAEGLNDLTVIQARDWVDTQLNGAETVLELKLATRKILKKMVPYLLK